MERLTDPDTGQLVINEVYKNEDIFSGPYAQDGPDLFVGTNRGYRVSWETALGMVPDDLFEDNTRKWSGDHLIDPKLVPGVIFLNKKIALREPSIIDIAPTVLDMFNVHGVEFMDGKCLFK
ncbi:MAG: hypothetical protein B6D53_02255 [Candidatus Omnitrophica bacterium 4484_49]|nr:MAG: hypothetical protein B6D53_02255 [Candidatus Omnitrophica bacterium 4484_49]